MIFPGSEKKGVYRVSERSVKAMPKKSGTFWKKVPCSLTGLALGLQSAVTAFLLFLSVFCTVFFQRSAPEVGNVTEKAEFCSGIPSAAFCLGTVALLVILALLAVGTSRLPKRWVLFALLIYVFTVQIIWLVALGFTAYSYPDSQSLIDAANILLTGNLEQFSPGYCPPGSSEMVCVNRNLPSAYTYFTYYPFQSGPMLWYLLVFALFGAKNVFAFQVVSAVAITALVAILWRFGASLGLNDVGQSALVVLIASCVPLLMFSAFVYPNAVGFFITVAGAAVVSEAFRMKKVWTSALVIVVGFMICGIGIVFKSTYQIILLATILAVLFAVLRNRRFWQMLVAFVSAAAAFVLSKMPVNLVQHWTGQDFGKGMPMISWIAIGLGKPENAPAGWWSRFALEAFEATNNDYEQQSQISMDFVKGRLGEFINNPSDGLRFFLEKISSEWAEPTFMTSIYSELGTSSNHFSGLASFLLVGQGSGMLLKYENVSQTVVYLTALIGLVMLTCAISRDWGEGGNANRVFVEVLLCASFLGGFLCYLLWEAKGIYTLPFYLLLLPMSAFGIQKCVLGVKKIQGLVSWKRARL